MPTKHEAANILFNLYDVRNILSKEELNKAKDSDGSEYTVGDCLDEAILFLEELEQLVDNSPQNW